MVQSRDEFHSDRSPVQEGQLAPHNVEAEEATLGSILLDPEVILECLFLKPGDFFLVRHGWIWEAMIDLREAKDPVDHVTVVDWLETRGRLAEVGGAAYIIGLINKTPSALNVEGYARIVQRMSLRRRLIGAAQQVARVAHSDETSIDVVLSQSEQAIFDVTRDNIVRRTVTVRELASDHFDGTMIALSENRPSTGIPTGYIDIDRVTGGMRPGNLVIIAARPGMGKTSYMLCMAMNIAHSDPTRDKIGKPVGFISLEMTCKELVTRMLVAETGLEFTALLDGMIPPDKITEYTNAIGKVGDLPILFNDDASSGDLQRALLIARQMVIEDGIRVLFVDYLQLMKAPDYAKDRNLEIGSITREFKQLAKELNITVVMGCQLSRATEARADKRGSLGDLRDSGEIEQNADIVEFIYRDAYYDAGSSDGNKSEINIAKNRNGRTGVVDLVFLPDRTQFVNARKISVNTDLELDEPDKKPAPKHPPYKKTTRAQLPFVVGRDDPGQQEDHTDK